MSGLVEVTGPSVEPISRIEARDHLRLDDDVDDDSMKTRIRMTYNLLNGASKLRYFKPCYKQYLTKHVRGKLALVPAPEWEIATFLPTADFQKASTSTIYGQSRSMI